MVMMLQFHWHFDVCVLCMHVIQEAEDGDLHCSKQGGRRNYHRCREGSRPPHFSSDG